jgi:hypothetical protein
LELGEDGLRLALLVLADQGPRPGLRKARLVQVTGETLADNVVPLRAAGERRR